MFSKKDYIFTGLGVITSLSANIIFKFGYHAIYISVILVLLIIVYVLNSKIQLVNYIGIHRIEKNISSGTNTEKLLEKVQNNFFLAGRGASRFIEAKNLSQTLSRVDRRIPIRFLVLNPDADAPKTLSQERKAAKNHISSVVKNSMETINQYISEGSNIEVRFYDNSNYIPIFRIVCIDNAELYVSFYKRQETGKNSFQLVLKDNKNDNNLYIAFKEHFEFLWETSVKS